MIYRFRRACSTRGSTHSPWAALRCAATLEGMPEPRRAAGRLGRRFEMVRCEYAAPAFVIAGLDTEKSAHPAWSEPGGDGSRLEIMREQSCDADAEGAHELQGQVASFPCFGPVSPCYRGAANRPDGRRAAPVSCVPLVAYGANHRRRVVPGVLFLSCYLQGFTGKQA